MSYTHQDDDEVEAAEYAADLQWLAQHPRERCCYRFLRPGERSVAAWDPAHPPIVRVTRADNLWGLSKHLVRVAAAYDGATPDEVKRLVREGANLDALFDVDD